MIRGNARILATGRMNALTKPNKSATPKNGTQSPTYVTPLTSRVATHNAAAFTIRRIRKSIATPTYLRRTYPCHEARRAERACEGAARGLGAPASDRAGVWGKAPPKSRYTRSNAQREVESSSSGINDVRSDLSLSVQVSAAVLPARRLRLRRVQADAGNFAGCGRDRRLCVAELPFGCQEPGPRSCRTDRAASRRARRRPLLSASSSADLESCRSTTEFPRRSDRRFAQFSNRRS